MRNRTAIMLAGIAVLGWAVGFVFMMRDFNRSDGESGGWTHPADEPPHDHATDEGPPIIMLADLSPLGFDSTTLSQIEPHFHVLNAALVTLVELHERFKATSDIEPRRYASVQSVTFHQTADKHERMIEALLNPDLKARFHSYMLRREADAGLHPDPAWHVHGSAANRNPLPLFQHPETRRGDTASATRE